MCAHGCAVVFCRTHPHPHAQACALTAVADTCAPNVVSHYRPCRLRWLFFFRFFCSTPSATCMAHTFFSVCVPTLCPREHPLPSSETARRHMHMQIPPHTHIHTRKTEEKQLAKWERNGNKRCAAQSTRVHVSLCGLRVCYERRLRSHDDHRVAKEKKKKKKHGREQIMPSGYFKHVAVSISSFFCKQKRGFQVGLGLHMACVSDRVIPRSFSAAPSYLPSPLRQLLTRAARCTWMLLFRVPFSCSFFCHCCFFILLSPFFLFLLLSFECAESVAHVCSARCMRDSPCKFICSDDPWLVGVVPFLFFLYHLVKVYRCVPVCGWPTTPSLPLPFSSSMGAEFGVFECVSVFVVAMFVCVCFGSLLSMYIYIVELVLCC